MDEVIRALARRAATEGGEEALEKLLTTLGRMGDGGLDEVAREAIEKDDAGRLRKVLDVLKRRERWGKIRTLLREMEKKHPRMPKELKDIAEEFDKRWRGAKFLRRVQERAGRFTSRVARWAGGKVSGGLRKSARAAARHAGRLPAAAAPLVRGLKTLATALRIAPLLAGSAALLAVLAIGVGLYLLYASDSEAKGPPYPAWRLADFAGHWTVEWDNTEAEAPTGALVRLWPPANPGEPAAIAGVWYARNATGERTFGTGFGGSMSIGIDGALEVTYGYGLLGHWDAKSRLLPRDRNNLSGEWTYSPERTGADLWRRVGIEVKNIKLFVRLEERGQAEPVAYGERGRIQVNPPPYSSFIIETSGPNHWGAPSIRLDENSGLRLVSTEQVCADGTPYQFGAWVHCVEWTSKRPDIALRHHIEVLETAVSGPKVLYVDDVPVPFDLVIAKQ
jgi:hypothetical protein